MNIKKLSQDFSVADQISAGDVSQIADAGFKSIICNRPDNEASGQPGFAEIEAAAAKAGLEVRSIPVGGGHDVRVAAEALARALQEMPKPVFAYCRSGARSTMLWQMVEDR